MPLTPPTLNLGAIGFINTLPIYGPWQGFAHTQLHYAPPAVLNSQLLSGQLQVSPVSSAFYLAHQRQLVLLPGLSVSSYGSVSSVLLLSKVPLNQVQAVSLPDDSATSVALVRLFMQQQLGRDAYYTGYEAAKLDTELPMHDTLLVIGDRALAASVNPPTPYVFDLSDWWVSHTELPVVFAVWAANRPWFERHPLATHQLIDSLCHARDRFFDDELVQALMVEQAVNQSGLVPSVVRRYFTHCLNYQWGADHEASLARFQAAIAYGTINALA
jgi:chorismate dehydratase